MEWPAATAGIACHSGSSVMTDLSMKIGNATITSASSRSSCSEETSTEKPPAFAGIPAMVGLCSKPSFSRNATRSLPST